MIGRRGSQQNPSLYGQVRICFTVTSKQSHDFNIPEKGPILRFFYLLTLLFYKRIWDHKDNDVLELNEISLTPYFLQCAG